MQKIDIHEVCRLTGRHMRTIRHHLARGTFPRPVDRTHRGYLGRDLWSREEVENWRDSRDGQGQAA